MCNNLIGINLIDFNALSSFLFYALFFDVFLQIANLLRHCDDSFSKGEIISFSGVSKSGAGSIAHAAGAGRSVRGAVGVDVQPGHHQLRKYQLATFSSQMGILCNLPSRSWPFAEFVENCPCRFIHILLI